MLELRPIKRDDGDPFIRRHHRHHDVPVGAIWRHAVHDDNGVLRGVAVVGRPVARALDDGLTVEVTRMCTVEAPNADSMLYGAARRSAESKGYRRGLTYLLASEWDRFDGDRRTGGAGARAAGYRFLWRVKGREWSCKSRPRAGSHPAEDKVALGWGEWAVITTEDRADER